MQTTTAPRTRTGKIYYGWVIVGVVALLRFASGTETNPVLGVLQGPMTDEFGWTRAMYAAPMTVGTVLGGILGLGVGPLMDRFGGRWLLTVSTAVLGLAFLLMGAVQEYWQHFVLQVAGRGILTAVFFLAVGVIVPKWFVAKRGRAVAVANIGQRAGQSTFPLLAGALIAVAGWREAWVAMGVLALVAGLLPTALFLRRAPEDLGLLPDGARPSDGGGPDGTARPAAARKPEPSMTTREVLRAPAFYLLLAAVSLNSFVITGVNFHWASYLTDQGLSRTVAVSSIALSPLVGVPTSIVAGFLVERVHVRYLLAGAFTWESGCIVILLFTHTATMAYVFALALGAATGMSMTAGAVVWADYFGRKSLGAVRGIGSPVQMVMNSMGPLVAAMAFDATGSLDGIFTVSAFMISAGAVLVVFAVPPKAVATAASRPHGEG